MSVKPKHGVFSNIGFIFKNIWRVDRFLLVAMVTMIFAKVCQPIIVIYMPKLIVQYFEEGRTVKELMLLVVYFGIVSLIVGQARSFSDGYFPRKNAYFRSMKLGSEMAMASLSVHYKYLASDKGQLEIRKAKNAVNRPTDGIQDFVIRLIECTTNFIGAFIYILILSSLNPLIIVGLILCGILSFLAGKRVNKYRMKTKDDVSKADKRLFYVNDSTRDVKYAKDVRMYGMYDWLSGLGEKLLHERNDWEKKISFKAFTSALVDGGIAFIRDGFAYIYLIFQVINGNLSVSEFILYIGSITGFSVWISNFVNNAIILSGDSLSISDFREFMIKVDDNVKQKISHRKIKTPISIELKDVCFSYGDEVIYENFNLKIEEGKKVALVGVNGAGKTTLVKLILNLLEPTSGQVLLNGVDAKEYDLHQYYSQFSVAFQDALVLAYGIDANVSMTSSEGTDQEQVDRAIQMAGLEEKVKTLKHGKYTSAEKYLDSEGVELSGGERQKLILARALYKDAPVLILDEPSSALDAIAEAELYEKYHKMTENKTSIYISHRLSSTKFCDEVLLLDGGHIIERGSHEELMAQGGKYSEMFTVQSHYYNEEEMEVVS